MSARIGDEFEPGEKCQASGIYRVTHDDHHVADHEVTVVFGKSFPPCRDCGDHPRFRAVRLAKHIENHDLFK